MKTYFCSDCFTTHFEPPSAFEADPDDDCYFNYLGFLYEVFGGLMEPHLTLAGRTVTADGDVNPERLQEQPPPDDFSIPF